MEQFSGIITSWYKKNKRDLPWRKTNDPYRIWLSEIIMQQTRVEQGTPYYLKFIRNFPTIKELAESDEEKVLKLWQGLGYYSRARNLHFTAKQIVSEYKGFFPSDFKELLKLKGVGEYTAAAIASFSFGEAHAVVDGNVYRVLSRIFGISTPIDSGKGRKEFYELANHLIDKKEPGTFNQAIMEFGAVQCQPKNPDCIGCSFNNKCYAYSTNRVGNYPVKGKSIKQKDRFFDYLLLKHKDTVILNKRGPKDIWEGLYDFPLIENLAQEDPETILASSEFKNLVGNSSPHIQTISKTYKHILSHQRIHARFWEINFSEPFNRKALASEIKIRKSALKKYAVPRLIENYLAERK